MVVVLVDGWADTDTGEVHRAGRPVRRLREKERALLAYLAERPGLTLGRTELYGAVWGYHPDTRSRTLDTTVRRVREALEPDPAPQLILTEPSVGYRFVPPAVGHDLPRRHVQDGLRGVTAERTVLWGPPGVGKSHWLRASGLPGVDDAPEVGLGLCTRPVRPRAPGVRAVEVTPLPPDAAAALVRARLDELGARDVPVPSDLSAYDGLPAALLAAADRAVTVGAFGPPPADDPLQRRYAALVAGDGALGAVAQVGALPAELVAEVFGQERVAAWLDRGLVRREGPSVQALAHVRRASVADRELAQALRRAISGAFGAAHLPGLGMPGTFAARDLARRLAPAVDDARFVVRRAVALGQPVPRAAPDDPDELYPWALSGGDPAQILSHADRIRSPRVRDAAIAVARRRAGQGDAVAGEPDPADRSIEAGEWSFQLGISAVALNRMAAGLARYREALDRVRGHDALEARVSSALGTLLVLAGRTEEATAALGPLCDSPDPTQRVEARLGLAFVGLLQGDVTAVRTHARAVRDAIPTLPPRIGAQVWVQLCPVWRDLGDVDAARAAALHALRELTPDLPPYVGGQAHFGLATTLLDAGEPEAALVHLAHAVASPGRPQVSALALVLTGVAHAWLGRPDEARRAALAGLDALGSVATRTSRLARAFAVPWAPLGADDIDEMLAFCDATRDPALRGVVLVAARSQGLARDGEVDGRFSAEVRLAERSWASLAVERGPERRNPPSV